MRLALLTPPTDAPSRIPLSRGLPSASALQVETGYLPRALPLPQMDVEASAAPFNALAKFAAAGGILSDRLTSVVVEAEAKKQNLENLAVQTSLFNKASEEIDTEWEAAKLTTDHNTARPAFNEIWKRVTEKYYAQAPNRDVQVGLGVRFTGLRTAKAGEVADTVRQKIVNFHEADIEVQSNAALKAIADPNTTEVERDLQIKYYESFMFGHANMGLVKRDHLERVRERTLTTGYNSLASQAMRKDPVAFLPKSEDNPEGGDGYKVFSATGKYPADQKYLAGLVDTTGPNLLTQRNKEKTTAQAAREKQYHDMLVVAWGSGFNQVITELASTDPFQVAVGQGRAFQLIENSGQYWTNAMKDQVRQLALDPERRGGVTDPVMYNALLRRMLENPDHVTNDEILKHAGPGGTLAWTGERSVESLTTKLKSLKTSDDLSQRPDYQRGREVVKMLPTGPSEMLALMGGMPGAMAKPENLARNITLVGDAIIEFDKLARSPEWKDKYLGDLGVEIRNKYLRLIFPDYVPPGVTPGSGGRARGR